MNLSKLRPPKGQKHKNQRIGQGMGSGRGKYSGRGAKGAKSVSGYSMMRGFEGGQMPLHRRLPKRGFTSLSRDDVAEVRTDSLEGMQATDIDLAALKAEGVVPRSVLAAKVILAGKLSRKVTLKQVKASKGAQAAIASAGGRYEFTEPKVEEKPKKEKKAKKPAAEEAPKAEDAKS
jgi:large subunit ribosomal protein L15